MNRSLIIVLTILASFGFCLDGLAQLTNTSLQAALIPSISISGPIGSMQELQCSTNPADSGSWTTLTFIRLETSPQNYLDPAPIGSRRFYRTILRNIADTNLVWIPPGTFLMGSPDAEEGRSTNEGPQTLVTFTNGFFMGRFEVRNIDWLVYSNVFDPGDLTRSNYLQRAVRQVNWYDATGYCATRTADELAAGKIPVGWAYRLPSEAEWEYACRAGTTTVFAFGNTLRNDDVRQDAWFDGISPYPTNLPVANPIRPALSDPNPHVAGSYTSNAFGLYDVHGNVLEWCLDRFDSSGPNNTPPTGYPGGSVTNPPPAMVTNGAPSSVAILRGGGFQAFSAGTNCRSAARIVRDTVGLGGSIPKSTGFRVVLAPVNP